MSILGVDFSENQRTLPFPAWVQTQEVRFCFGRATIGYRQDAVYPQYLYQAQDAGIEFRGAYSVILHHDSNVSFFDPVRQCRTFIERLIPGLVSLAVLDIEAAGVTEGMVRQWCDVYDAEGPVPLLLYGNLNLENILGINNPRYDRYDLWNADYGPGTITSVPPVGSQYPRTSRVGKNRGRLWQFAGNNGRLAPYTFPIDLSRFDGTETELAEFFGVQSQPPEPDWDTLRKATTIIKIQAQGIMNEANRIMEVINASQN